MLLFLASVLLGCDSETEDTGSCASLPCEEAPPLCSDAGDADAIEACLCVYWLNARTEAEVACDRIDERELLTECPWVDLDDYDADDIGKIECYVTALGEDCSVREDDAWEGYFQNAKECPWG